MKSKLRQGGAASKKSFTAVGVKSFTAVGVKKHPIPGVAGKCWQSLVAVDKQILIQFADFFQEYGCKPTGSSQLGKSLKDLFDRRPAVGGLGVARAHYSEAPFLQPRFQKQVDEFLNAWRSDSGRKMKKWRIWASTYRARQSPHKGSAFSNALCSSPGPGKHRVVEIAAFGAKEEINTSAAIPTVARHLMDGSILHLTPAPVVDWLYQAVVDIHVIVQRTFGVASFDAVGNATAAGLADVTLFWGSFLGSLRDQALIAWDYDADLALWLAKNISEEDFSRLWACVSRQLELLGYRCSMHNPLRKLRVAPPVALAWAPYKELYQETRVQKGVHGKARPAILQKTAGRWRRGERAIDPLGANCVDIDVYWLGRDKIPIMGSKPFSVSSSDVFPTALGVFGPLLLPTPRTSKVLLKEYGSDCLRKRRAKIITKGGHFSEMHDVADGELVRRSAWPQQRSRLGDLQWS